MRNSSDKFVEKIKTHFLSSKGFFFFENRTVYETTWKKIVQQDWPQIKIWRMRIACWIPKATNTHSGCVILVTFPLQQWLHENASMLLYMYIVPLVLFFTRVERKIKVFVHNKSIRNA
jgi:hypothetical protein